MITDLDIENLSVDSNNRYGYATVGGKMGVINSSYKWVIEPKYDDIKSVGENAFKFKVENKYGVVDSYGNTIIPPEYDFITGNPKSNKNTFIVKGTKKRDNTSYFSLITSDNLPLSPMYDFMWYGEDERFVFLENNKFGIYGIGTDNCYCEIIPAEYDEMKDYTDFIVVGKRHKEVTCENETLNVDDVTLYGVIDYNNNIITPLQYKYMEVSENKVYEIPLKDRTFFVNNDNGKYVIINYDNEKVCDTEFDSKIFDIGDFAYEIYKDKADTFPYIIDKFGNIFGCDNDNSLIKPFEKLNNTESISVRTNGNKKEVINNSGDILFSSDFETMDTNENNLIFIKKGCKYGAVDRNNNIIIPFEEGPLWGRYDFVVRKIDNIWKPVVLKG